MSLKSWGLELWDQVDKVFQHANQGLEQIELYYRTVTDIHKVYLSLVRKHKAIGISTSSKTKLVIENSTYNVAFSKFLTCINDQSTIYETQAEELKDNVINPIKLFIETLRTSISAQILEYNKFKTSLENHKRILDRAWAKYYQAFVNKKRAEANYNKIKDDKTVPRVDIEKVQSVANQKQSDFEKMRGEYASQLQTFNQNRCGLYLQDLPKLCSELEMLDRKRAEITTETGLALVSIQEKHLKRTGTCNESVADAVRTIDFRSDSAALISHKSGLLYPPDIIFVDLEKVRGESFNSQDFPGIFQQGGKVEKNDTAKSLFGCPLMKGIEPKEMLPEQVKLKLDEVFNAIKRVEKSLSGIKTLWDTYGNNPNMGDRSSLQPQMDIFDRQLLSLRDMSDSISKQFQNLGGDVNSIIKRTPTVQSDSTAVDSDGSFDEDEDDEIEASPVLITGHTESNLAKVLYDFEPSDSQQLAVFTDMSVKVLTYDDSESGWTLVQSTKDVTLKGYVPTNYIKML